MAELEERRFRGWDVLRLSTEALTAEIIPGLGGTITSLRRRARRCRGALVDALGAAAPCGALGAGHVASPDDRQPRRWLADAVPQRR